MQGIHNHEGAWHCTATSKYGFAVPTKTARNPSKKKKEEKEPKNLRSVNMNENHLFTVHRLGWKETVARELQEKKGDLPT